MCMIDKDECRCGKRRKAFLLSMVLLYEYEHVLYCSFPPKSSCIYGKSSHPTLRKLSNLGVDFIINFTGEKQRIIVLYSSQEDVCSFDEKFLNLYFNKMYVLPNTNQGASAFRLLSTSGLRE